MRNKNKEIIKSFNVVPISQFTFPYSNISKFSSLLDIWKWSLWNQLDICLSAEANSNDHIAPIPWTQDFSSFQTLESCQTELTLHFKMEQMHSKKKTVAHSSSGKQLSIHLILPSFTVSGEGAAPLCSNSQPDQLPQLVWDHGILFFAFVGFRFPPPVIYKAKILGPNATNVPACFNYKHMSTPKLRPWNSSRLKHIVSDAGNSCAYAFPYPLEHSH